MGVSMTDLIEPGTIPTQCVALMLPSSYKHPYEASAFHKIIWVYIHESNLAYAPMSTERFNIWSETPITATPGFKQTQCPKMSNYFGEYMCEIEREDKPAPICDAKTASDLKTTKPSEPEPVNRFSKFKVTSSDLADFVTQSKLNSSRIIETRAYEIAEHIHTKLMKAVTDGTAHLGLELQYSIRADHGTAITKLLGQTFPFMTISHLGHVLTAKVPIGGHKSSKDSPQGVPAYP